MEEERESCFDSLDNMLTGREQHQHQHHQRRCYSAQLFEVGQEKRALLGCCCVALVFNSLLFLLLLGIILFYFTTLLRIYLFLFVSFVFTSKLLSPTLRLRYIFLLNGPLPHPSSLFWAKLCGPNPTIFVVSACLGCMILSLLHRSCTIIKTQFLD